MPRHIENRAAPRPKERLEEEQCKKWDANTFQTELTPPRSSNDLFVPSELHFVPVVDQEEASRRQQKDARNEKQPPEVDQDDTHHLDERSSVFECAHKIQH